MPHSQSRIVRVFVSSTFRDFHKEREILVKRVFPALRQKLRSRGITLNDIDLRWGITERQAERGETLPICLSLIDECRPYFVGLLGERYGWRVPEGAITDALKARFPVLETAAGQSVTEIEFRHAVLTEPTANQRAFVFLRDGGWVNALPADARPDHVAESPEALRKVASLKRSLVDCRLVSVERYSSPEAFADLVAARLSEALEADFPYTVNEDWLSEEGRKQAIVRDDYCRLYIGHTEYVAALDQWYADTALPFVVVTGASGAGKTALLANWVSHQTLTNPRNLIFEHYLGATPDSGDTFGLLRRLLIIMARETQDVENLPQNDDDLIASIPAAFDRASADAERKGYKWIIVLDGLDKLSSRQDLGWLPGALPKNLRLIASSNESPALQSCLQRRWPNISIEPLPERERQRFVERLFAVYGKSLTAAQTGRVLGHPLSGLPLFLKTLVDELRIFGVHERLTKRLEWYLAANSMAELFERLLARLETDFGGELTRAALSLIWAGRAGIEQKELLAILGVPEAVWQPLYHSIGDNVRDASGRLLASHEYFRNAIETRYLRSADAKKECHRVIARHFAQHDWASRKAEEWPWQLIQARDFDQLEALLTNIDQFKMLASNGHEQLRAYWVAADRAGKDIHFGFEQNWHGYHKEIAEALAAQRIAYLNPKTFIMPELLEFVLRSGYSGSFAAEIASEIVETLRWAEKFDAWWRDSLLTALQVLNNSGGGDEVRGILQRLDGRWGSAWRGDDLSSMRIRSLEAVLRAEEGNLGEAITLAEETLKSKRKLLGESDRSVLVDMNNLAGFYRRAGRLKDAEQLYRSAYERRLSLLGSDAEDTLVSAGNLANSLLLEGKVDEAMALFGHVLEKETKQLGAAHSSTLMAGFRLAECLRLKGKTREAGERLQSMMETLETTQRTHENTYLLAAQSLAMLKSSEQSEKAGSELLVQTLTKVRQGRFPAPDNFGDLVAAFDEAATRGKDKRLAEVGYREILRACEQWEKTDIYSYYYVQGRIGSLLYDRVELDGAAAMYRDCVYGLLGIAAGTKLSDDLRENLAKLVDANGEHFVETLRRLGQMSEACREAARLAADWSRLLGRPGERPAQIEGQLVRAAADVVERGRLLNSESEVEAAEAMLRLACRSLSDTLGPAHEKSLSVMSSLGAFYGRVGEHSKALEVFGAGFEIANRRLGKDAEITRMFVENCAAAAAHIERTKAGGPAGSQPAFPNGNSGWGVGSWWRKSRDK